MYNLSGTVKSIPNPVALPVKVLMFPRIMIDEDTPLFVLCSEEEIHDNCLQP